MVAPFKCNWVTLGPSNSYIPSTHAETLAEGWIMMLWRIGGQLVDAEPQRVGLQVLSNCLSFICICFEQAICKKKTTHLCHYHSSHLVIPDETLARILCWSLSCTGRVVLLKPSSLSFSFLILSNGENNNYLASHNNWRYYKNNKNDF